jgi:phenylacetate-CoA ligase
MSQGKIRKFAYELIKFKPDVLRGYGSAIYFFAQFIKKEEIKVNPKIVITTGDGLMGYERQQIREIFECDVFDFYASREISAIAAECPTHQGYHVTAENLALEIVKDGEPVADGETGIVLITNFNNYAMPFIRYCIGDLAKSSGEKCSCGRNLPLIESIEGRMSDVLVNANGTYTASPSAHYVFKGLKIRQYQIIQEDYEQITIKIVKEKGFSERDIQSILQRTREYLGPFKVNLEFVNSILQEKSGKRRVIISRVPFKFIQS